MTLPPDRYRRPRTLHVAAVSRRRLALCRACWRPAPRRQPFVLFVPLPPVLVALGLLCAWCSTRSW